MPLYQVECVRNRILLCVRKHDLTGSISKLCYSELFLWEHQLLFKAQLVLLVVSNGTTLFYSIHTMVVVRSNEMMLSAKISLFVAGVHAPGRKVFVWVLNLIDYSFHLGSSLTIPYFQRLRFSHSWEGPSTLYLQPVLQRKVAMCLVRDMFSFSFVLNLVC